MTTANARKWADQLEETELDKQEQLFDVRVSHKKLTTVVDEVAPLLTPHSETSLIAVVGAPGVGKTTFGKYVLQRLYSGYSKAMALDASVIPVIRVEAYADGEARHSFRGLYKAIGNELAEPAEHGRSFAEVSEGRMRIRSDSRKTIGGLREAIEAALKHRRTEVLVVDEAYHLLKLSKDTAVMDTLKSLANTTGVKIVLIGSYDLLDLIAVQGQVARRAAVVHFDRYHLDCAADRDDFKKVVRAIQLKWPSAEVPHFVLISDALMELSLGCVGLLKTFLLEAHALQLRNGGKWDPVFLKRAAKANKLRAVIQAEIRKGEDKIRDSLCGESLWDDKAVAELDKLMKASDE
jgi:nucleoside-triphosphatase THEP1